MTPMEFKKEVTRIISEIDDDTESRHSELDDLMERYILENDKKNKTAIDMIRDTERWYA